MFDYQFVSTVNRAYSLHPEKLKGIFEETIQRGSRFQRAYLCGLLDYCASEGINLGLTVPDTVLPNVECTQMVKDGYDNNPPIPEFLNRGIYITKVGWL